MHNSHSRSLHDKTVLITGAARRVGAHIAARLHEAGARIAIHYRGSKQPACELRDRLNSARPDSTEIFQADLNQLDQIDALIRSVSRWAGGIDVLVNNASSFYPTPLGTVTEQQWNDLMGSNLKAPLFLAQAAMQMLISAKGSIVNIVDIHASKPLRDHPVYGAAKAGLTMLTRSLAKDLAPDVRVNGVAPGAIMWPEDGLDDAAKKRVIARTVLKRTGVPGDVSRAVLFLIADGGYITGQVIRVDGGRSIFL